MCACNSGGRSNPNLDADVTLDHPYARSESEIADISSLTGDLNLYNIFSREVASTPLKLVPCTG